MYRPLLTDEEIEREGVMDLRNKAERDIFRGSVKSNNPLPMNIMDLTLHLLDIIDELEEQCTSSSKKNSKK